MTGLHIFIIIVFVLGFVVTTAIERGNRAQEEWELILKDFGEETLREESPEYTDEEVGWILESNADYLSVDVSELLAKTPTT